MLIDFDLAEPEFVKQPVVIAELRSKQFENRLLLKICGVTSAIPQLSAPIQPAMARPISWGESS